MSFDKVEVRVFSGPDQVQVGSNTKPDLVVINIGPKGDTGATGSTGPAGPNSVTSATTSDGTGQIMLDTLAVGICNILDEVVFDTLTYTFAEGSAQALKDALDISFADVSDAQTGTAILDVESITGIYIDGDVFTATSGTGTAVVGTSDSGVGAQFYSQNNYGAIIGSAGGNSLKLTSVSGDYYIECENNFTTVESAIERVRGWFVWFYNTFTGRLKTADITADRDWILPDASGTLALTSQLPTLGTNVATFLATPSSANLAAAVTDETGSGSLVFAESPSLTSPTIGTSATFNATTYTYGAGAAAAHRTALGLVSNTDLLSSVYEWSKSTADYSATNVGTGTSSTATNVMQLNTLATAGSSALLRSDANDFRAWQKYSGNRQAVDWSKKTMHFVRISSDAFSGADTIFRIYLGLPYTLTTVQDLQSANTAIGFKVINGVIFVQVSNGSAVTTTTTGVTMSAWLVYDCMIQSNGDGTWTATVNSTTVTGSGAPSTTSAASNAALIMSAANGTTASARRFFINTQRSMQHD
jgi:hypothetical protein